MTYSEWFKQIQWLRDKVILPDGTRIDKSFYMTFEGIDIDEFNKMLFDEYKKRYPNK